MQYKMMKKVIDSIQQQILRETADICEDDGDLELAIGYRYLSDNRKWPTYQLKLNDDESHFSWYVHGSLNNTQDDLPSEVLYPAQQGWQKGWENLSDALEWAARLIGQNTMKAKLTIEKTSKDERKVTSS